MLLPNLFQTCSFKMIHIVLDWLEWFSCSVGFVREWTAPAASVWWCCTSVSLPGCGVGGGASHFGLSVGPGAVCVCCRLESAAVTHASIISRLQSSAAAVGMTRFVCTPCCWSCAGSWTGCVGCCPSPLVGGAGCGAEGPRWAGKQKITETHPGST